MSKWSINTMKPRGTDWLLNLQNDLTLASILDNCTSWQAQEHHRCALHKRFISWPYGERSREWVQLYVLDKSVQFVLMFWNKLKTKCVLFHQRELLRPIKSKAYRNKPQCSRNVSEHMNLFNRMTTAGCPFLMWALVCIIAFVINNKILEWYSNWFLQWCKPIFLTQKSKN